MTVSETFLLNVVLTDTLLYNMDYVKKQANF